MGLEPTTSHVTGERSNQLSYDRKFLLVHSNRKQSAKQTAGVDGDSAESDLAIGICPDSSTPLKIRSSLFLMVSTGGIEPPTSSL